MTKIDIVECVYEKVGFSKKEASALVEFVFDAIKSSLERGEKVKVSGFGAFQPRFKRSRAGRNPHSGEPMEITARRVVRFVPSELLKAQLNAASDDGAASPEE